MNLPNKLTLTRLIMVVFFAITAFPFPNSVYGFFGMTKYGMFIVSIIAFALYILASITDALDGKIARKYNMVTDFGKFVDPIADKLLVTSALISLIWLDFNSWKLTALVWATFIILARELIVSAVRMVAASKGKIVAADMLGKAKMVAQTIAIVILLAANIFKRYYSATGKLLGVANVLDFVGIIFLAIATVLTILSGINYLVKNKECFSQMK